jgi:hypothetical protein
VTLKFSCQEALGDYDCHCQFGFRRFPASFQHPISTMKHSILALLLLSSALTASAKEILWSANATVSAVSGTGFNVTDGDPVSVRFSYQSDVLVNVIDAFVFPPSTTYAKTEFYGNIGLTVEVTIGGNTWRGALASAPDKGTNALLTEAWDGGGPSDSFTVLAASSAGGVFAPFPYTGSESSRSLRIVLQDTTSPPDFIPVATLPTETAAIQKITAASGTIAAGTDQVNFTIDLSTLTVSAEKPTLPLTITTTQTGIELSWPSTDGVTYRLDEGDALTDWQPLGTFPGTGSTIVVPLSPFADHPNRRFYRVVAE